MSLERQENDSVTAFTLRRIRADIIEECAKVAEEAYSDPNWHMLYRMAGTAIAARIRDLSNSTGFRKD